MKKNLSILFLLFIILSITACGKSDESFISEQTENRNENNDKTDAPISGKNGHNLDFYSSRTNNTEHVAQTIQSILDCDILEVEPQIPYDDNYNSMLNRAQKELEEIRQGNYPAIKTSVDNFDNYDIIFIGYPIWWNLAPRIIDTFIETHHLAGKTLIPFATSGGSGITNSVGALKKAYPDLNWKEGKLLNRMDENGIREWIGKTSKD